VSEKNGSRGGVTCTRDYLICNRESDQVGRTGHSTGANPCLGVLGS